MPKRIRKNHHKKALQKSILASVLASQNLPKSTQQRKKSKKTPFEKKLKKKSHGSYRESTEGKHFGTPPDHPTIIPMISTSPLTFRWRPNHSLSPPPSQKVQKSTQNPFKIYLNVPKAFPKSVKMPNAFQKLPKHNFSDYLSTSNDP